MTIHTEMSNEELGTTLEERMIAEEYKIWKKNTPCELGCVHFLC
jgi:hypothetical protein